MPSIDAASMSGLARLDVGGVRGASFRKVAEELVYTPRTNTGEHDGEARRFPQHRRSASACARAGGRSAGGQSAMVTTTTGGNGRGTSTIDPTAPAYLEQHARENVWIHQAPWVDIAEGDGLHVFDRGEGVMLYDVHGRAFYDGISGLWVVNAGHGRKEIGEVMGAQAARLAYASAMTFTTVPAVQLADMLAQRTPGDLNRVFFCSGGSEAVESALKIA